MKRRQFLSATLGMPVLLAAVAGCGSGDGSRNLSPGSASGGGDVSGRGAAEGFVFFTAAGSEVTLFNTAAEGAAAGLQPASGIRAEIVGGSSAVVGKDGLLRLTQIEPGQRILRLSSGSRDLPRDVPLTVVPKATLPLGTTPISRAVAVESVKAQVGADALAVADVLASSTPLPAGVSISLAIQSDLPAIVTKQATWLVYVDTLPTGRFGHETYLGLVDATTGTVQLIPAESWPLFNGASFYGLSDVNVTSADAVQVAARALATLSGATVPLLSQAHRATPSGACRAADPDKAKTHFLIIQGDSNRDFGGDPPGVTALLQSAPFPPTGTMEFVKTFEYSIPPREVILSAFNRVRDAAGSGDTLVVFVATHGTIYPARTIDAAEEKYRMVCQTAHGITAQSHTQDGYLYETEYFDIRELDFSPCKACRIILIPDTCYSGNWIPILRPRLDALEKRDILILTSANQSRKAQGGAQGTVDFGDEGSFTYPYGGVFTQSLLFTFNREKTSAEAGAISTDLLERAFYPAAALTNLYNGDTKMGAEELKYFLFQNPQQYHRPLGPDDVCGKGNQDVTIQ